MKSTDNPWSKHIPHLESLSQINNSCVFLLEAPDTYRYVSPNFSTFFKSPIAVTIENVEAYIHPDDLTSFHLIRQRLETFFTTLMPEERMNYKHIYEFRTLAMNDHYIRITTQIIPLEAASSEHPAYLLGIVDLSPDQSTREGIKFKLFNNETGDIIPFPITPNDPNLSRREIEILHMISQGLLSKEISAQLYISIHTVNGHRQNILRKLNTDNVIEAINHARKLGLLTD